MGPPPDEQSDDSDFDEEGEAPVGLDAIHKALMSVNEPGPARVVQPALQLAAAPRAVADVRAHGVRKPLQSVMV